MEEKKPKKREWVKNAAIIFLAVMLVLTFFSNTILNRTLPEVVTRYVETGSIDAKVRVSGTVSARENYDVIIDQTRKVAAVNVKVGQEVSTGDVLFTLESGDSAELEEAKKTLEQLRINYQRFLLSMDNSDPDYFEDDRRIAQTREDLAKAIEKRDALPNPTKEALDNAKAAVSDAKAAVEEIDAQIRELNDAQKEAAYGEKHSTDATETEENPALDSAVQSALEEKSEARKKLQAALLGYGDSYRELKRWMLGKIEADKGADASSPRLRTLSGAEVNFLLDVVDEMFYLQLLGYTENERLAYNGFEVVSRMLSEEGWEIATLSRTGSRQSSEDCRERERELIRGYYDTLEQLPYYLENAAAYGGSTDELDQQIKNCEAALENAKKGVESTSDGTVGGGKSEKEAKVEEAKAEKNNALSDLKAMLSIYGSDYQTLKRQLLDEILAEKGGEDLLDDEKTFLVDVYDEIFYLQMLGHNEDERQDKDSYNSMKKCLEEEGWDIVSLTGSSSSRKREYELISSNADTLITLTIKLKEYSDPSNNEKDLTLSRAYEKISTARTTYEEAIEDLTVAQTALDLWNSNNTAKETLYKGQNHAYWEKEVERLERLLKDLNAQKTDTDKLNADQELAYQRVSAAKEAYSTAVKTLKDARDTRDTWIREHAGKAAELYEGKDHSVWTAESERISLLLDDLSSRREDAQSFQDRCEQDLAEMEKQQGEWTTADDAVKGYQKDLEDQLITLAKKREDDAKAAGKTQQMNALDIREKLAEIEEWEKKVEELSGETSAEVKSKVNGTVASLSVSAGHNAEAGKTLASIEVRDMGYTMTATVTVDQARLLHVGDTASISNYYWGSRTTATIASIQPDPKDPRTGRVLTFELDGDINAGDQLSFSIGEKNASYDLVVPNSAIRSDTNGSFVLMVTAKNSPLGNRYFATRVDVEVVAQDDYNTAVKGALSNMDSVITTSSGNAPVKNGDQVRLADTNS